MIDLEASQGPLNDTLDNNMQNIKNITQGYVNSDSGALQKAQQIGDKSLKELNKEFTETGVFVPSEEQIAFLRSVFNPKTGSELADWIEHAHISEATLKYWWNSPGFSEWITAEAERRTLLYRLEWLAIGLKKMHHNPDTWKFMANIFYPKGVENSPSEKGSKRYQLEQEAKKLIKSKEKQSGNNRKQEKSST